MGRASALAPLLVKMPVSTMPGCRVAAKRFECSAARNSISFVCASLDDMYADSPGTMVAGRAVVPVVTAMTAAWVALAVGKNA